MCFSARCSDFGRGLLPVHHSADVPPVQLADVASDIQMMHARQPVNFGPHRFGLRVSGLGFRGEASNSLRPPIVFGFMPLSSPNKETP